MKTSKLILILFISIVCGQKIMAQSTEQITRSELQNLYDNGDYKKAISFIDQFLNKKDDIALIILGDCCLKESSNREEQVNKMYYQSQMTQSMAIAQGLYFDNSMAIMFYQQAQQEILQLRLKAVNLYSKASSLGNKTGNQRMALINSLYGNNSGASNSSSYGGSSNSQYQTKTKQKCGYCSGTGRIESTVATYGYGGTKWCDFCKRDVLTSHCCQCKICPSCGGKGYR